MLFPVGSRQCGSTVPLTVTVYSSSEAWRMLTCLISSQSPVSISSTRKQLLRAGKGGAAFHARVPGTLLSCCIQLWLAPQTFFVTARLPANRGQASYSLRSQSHRVIQSFNNLGMSKTAKLALVHEAAARDIWIQ